MSDKLLIKKINRHIQSRLNMYQYLVIADIEHELCNSKLELELPEAYVSKFKMIVNNHSRIVGKSMVDGLIEIINTID